MIASKGHENFGRIVRRIRVACLARPELIRNLLALVALFSIGFV